MDSLALLRILKVTYTIALISGCLFIQENIATATFELDLKEALAKEPKREQLNVKRSDFPCDFLFGAATAAVQIEGAVAQDGKGKSVWDQFIDTPGKTKDGLNLNALDSYNRYMADIKALKELGVNSYRFSIPWTRILPSGSLSGGVNRKAIDHYNRLINELLHNGIKPFVTLLHFDSPQALEDKYKGFLSRKIVDDFKDFSRVCFEEFGDRVKSWITINEPLIMAQMGFDLGVAPPGRCSTRITGKCRIGDPSTEPYIVAHNILLAHATAVKLYKDNFAVKQGGEIGLCNVGKYFEPYSNSVEDQAAAKRLMDFQVGWFMEPLVFGDYPKSMKDYVKERLPRFTSEEKKLMKGSFDFIGVNYYTSRFGKSSNFTGQKPRYTTDPLASEEFERNGVLIGPKATGSQFIYIYPEGLQKLLLFMKKNYQSPKIYITENGISELNTGSAHLAQSLKDTHRIVNTLRHLYMINLAIKNGVNVKGYFAWSLFDDFEYGDGYTSRFGLYFINYQDNLKRIPKMSAKWFPVFLSGKNPHIC